MTLSLRARAGAIRSDQLLVNSVLMLATTLLMAAGGALFWVLAARLESPENVGLAGSLVASAETIALFAQLGLNIALVRTLPTSTRKAADVVTAGVVVTATGIVLALAYAWSLPLTSPRLAQVLHAPWIVVLFAVLVALTALNVVSDSVFLGLNRLRAYLLLNGVLLNVVKLGLPVLLMGAGAFGLYGAVAGAATVTGLASIWVVLRHLPGQRSLRPSRQLFEARSFAGASYAQYALAVLPLLVYPVLVVNALGAAEAGAYFVAFQVAMLLHAALLALGNAAYAEAERATSGRHQLVRRSVITLIGGTAVGAVLLGLLAPYLLWIFGPHYVEQGTSTLRMLALAVVCASYNYWGAFRLRLSRHLRAIVLVQLASTITMLGLGWALAPHGTVWVAASWAVGQLLGGVLGHLVSSTIAPFADGESAPPAAAEGRGAGVRRRLRNLALSALLASLRTVLGVLSRVFPQSRSVVIAGFPETEGNAVEAARALLRRYPGRVVWLRGRGDIAREVTELEAQGARLVAKASAAGLWAYLRAELVLFTHGLYGSPTPVARKPIVNLWHGDGPKDIRPRVRSERIASTYVAGSTALFTHLTKCAAFDVPRERALITGNPRTDQLWRPADADHLHSLGIGADFVIWMPTWRRVRGVGSVITTDGYTDTTDDDLALETLVVALADRGLQLVVKPHPMDADPRVDPRWVTVGDEDLVRTGISLYQLLGASAGLVTDYSSVWTDYLLLDRPMAFLVTDRHTFNKALFPADVLGWLPGELVEHATDAFGEFLADLDSAGTLGARQRKEVAGRIGLHQSRTAGEDLVAELGRRGILRQR